MQFTNRSGCNVLGANTKLFHLFMQLFTHPSSLAYSFNSSSLYFLQLKTNPNTREFVKYLLLDIQEGKDEMSTCYIFSCLSTHHAPPTVILRNVLATHSL